MRASEMAAENIRGFITLNSISRKQKKIFLWEHWFKNFLKLKFVFIYIKIKILCV